MNKTANLYARIEPDVKEQAENVLEPSAYPFPAPSTCSTSRLFCNREFPST